MIFVVGGGGKLKNTDAVLIVTVPTGSTVTATKGGTTLMPTMWVKAADTSLDCAIFSIPASKFDSTTPWTITATDGTNTASTTVLIATNKEYEITLAYERTLFYNGITDGELSSFDAVASATIGTEITTTNNLSTGNYWVSTNPLVIPAIYSKLNFEARASYIDNGYPMRLGLMTTKPVSGNYVDQQAKFVAYKTNGTTSSNYSVFTIDISQYAGLSYYIGMMSVSTSSTRKIWLSK